MGARERAPSHQPPVSDRKCCRLRRPIPNPTRRPFDYQYRLSGRPDFDWHPPILAERTLLLFKHADSYLWPRNVSTFIRRLARRDNAICSSVWNRTPFSCGPKQRYRHSRTAPLLRSAWIDFSFYKTGDIRSNMYGIIGQRPPPVKSVS